MLKHQRELWKWKALAIVATALFIILSVDNGNTIRKLESKVTTVEQEVRKAQEDNKKLNIKLEQAKREKAEAEAKAISRQRAVEQSTGSKSGQFLGTCDYRITTAVGYAKADSQLVVQEIDRVFGAQARLAKAVFQSESGLRSNACSTTNDWGVCQVNRTAHPQYSVEFLMNYKNNVQACWAISSGGTNFNPWSDFKNGNYLKYL